MGEVTGKRTKIKDVGSKENLEEFNPCLKEQNLSKKCMNINNYNKDECEIYFENFRRCKKFWGKVQKDRRNRGITPALPPVEDRAKVKEEYLKKKTFF